MKRLFIWGGLAVGLGVVLLATAHPAFAKKVNYGTVTPTIDCAGPTYILDWSLTNADADIAATLEVVNGGSSGGGSAAFSKGYYGTLHGSATSGGASASANTDDPDGSLDVFAIGGAATLTGDGYVEVKSDGVKIYSVHFLYDCTGGAPGVITKVSEFIYSPEKPGEPYTGIVLLPDDAAAPYLSVPTADGATPCGVFDVNGWGRKYVGMADFPACTAPVTVMCLTDTGQWTADNVSNVVYQGDYEVDFTSSQDGTCAFFSQ